MGQTTLRDLQKHINKLLKEHPELKDRKVVISNDNEGNGFHGMFYGVTYEYDDVKAYKDEIYDSQTTNPNEIVLLG